MSGSQLPSYRYSALLVGEEPARMGMPVARDLLGCALRHHGATARATLGPEVDKPVCALDHVQAEPDRRNLRRSSSKPPSTCSYVYVLAYAFNILSTPVVSRGLLESQQRVPQKCRARLLHGMLQQCPPMEECDCTATLKMSPF